MEKYKINFLKISSIMQLYLGLKLMMFVQIPKFSDYMLKKNTERIGEIYFNFKTFVWLINLQTPGVLTGTIVSPPALKIFNTLFIPWNHLTRLNVMILGEKENFTYYIPKWDSSIIPLKFLLALHSIVLIH